MKTIKPQRLGVMHRTFENDGRCYFVPTVMVCFAFDAPDVPLHEAAMWKMVAAELGPEAAPDEAMRKIRGEVLVTGRAYPPGGNPAIACAARIQIGSVDKRLYVVGDRRWERGVATDPVPFTTMPITWSNAFGGEGFDENPAGKGFAPVNVVDVPGAKIHALPNVEDPRRLISSPRDRPHPVGLGPVDINAPHRRKRAGTYGKRWLEESFPGFPPDLDWLFFNVAPEDQWIEGNFAGGEPFVVEGMHPGRPRIESRLPRLRPRCFVTRKGDADKKLCEIALQCDTVHLFPGVERGVAFYRGVIDVVEDDAADLSELLACCEGEGLSKPVPHYRDVLVKRLDKMNGALFAMRETDLLPPLARGVDPMGTAELGDLAALIKPEGHMTRNFRARAEKELERVRELCRQNDVDPDLHLPKELPPAAVDEPDLDHLDTYVEQKKAEAEKARAEAEQKKEELLARARQMCEEQKIDFDAIRAKALEDEAGPPKYRAEQQLEQLRQMKQLSDNAGVPIAAVEVALADPKLFERLLATERQLLDAYRRCAQHFPPARGRPEEESLRQRVLVQAAHDAGESLAGRDLTGVDLSRIALQGADLRGALLEAANLTGADLRGALLQGAVLVRADLSETRLAGANLTGANLGAAKLHRTDLTGADLSRADLTRAELTDTILEDALLQQALLLDAVVRGGRFSRVRAKQLVLHKLDLTGVIFTGAELPECVIIETCIDRADFSRANLEGACLIQVQGEGARFEAARCNSLRVVYNTRLVGSVFRGASLLKSNFRGTDLAGSDFEGAELTGSDLSEADLSGANLERIVAKDALFIRTKLEGARVASANLMRAILQKAHVEGADMRDTNLFRADFAKVAGDKETRFDGANLKQMRIVKRRDHGRA